MTERTLDQILCEQKLIRDENPNRYDTLLPRKLRQRWQPEDAATDTTRARAIAITLEQETAALTTERDRYQAVLQQILDEQNANQYRPDRDFPTEQAKHWHDGYVTYQARIALLARRALDPAGAAAADRLEEAAAVGSDADWYQATGHCGTCARVGDACSCDGKCGCWADHGPPKAPYVPDHELVKIRTAERDALTEALAALTHPYEPLGPPPLGPAEPDCAAGCFQPRDHPVHRTPPSVLGRDEQLDLLGGAR